MSKSKLLAALLIGICAAFLWSRLDHRRPSVQGQSNTADEMRTQIAASSHAQLPDRQAPTPQSSRNPAHDRLLALPPAVRATALSLGLAPEDQCIGKRAFYRGMSPETKAVYWSLSCTNGRSYQFEIAADTAGSSKYASCAVLKVLAGDDCFKQFTAE